MKVKILSAAIASAVSATVAQQGLAQDQKSEVMLSEEIVVTGYRDSIRKARDLKFEAIGSQDSILAEDVADFPDLNLADSLQRIPGVAITREGGEGRRISLRGLGPDFTRVQLNGMEVLGNTDSPMDSRGQATRDRAFDFTLFASELFNQIDVYKTYSAKLDEGGIAGTVGLHTGKPFDHDGFKAAISTNVGSNTQADELSPRIAGIISNNWGDYGALFSIAYSERDVNEQGYNTYRWRQRTPREITDAADNVIGYHTDFSALTADEQQKFLNNELHFPRGARYSVWQNEQERLGITSAFQFNASEDLQFTVDALYGELNNVRNENHIQSRGHSSTALGNGDADHPQAVITALDYNTNDEVVFASYENSVIASETRYQEVNTSFYQFSVKADWTITDTLSATGLIGTSESEFETPVGNKFYMETFGGVTQDFRGDRFYGRNTYNFDPTNESVWSAHEIDLREEEQTSTFDNVKLDFTYALNEDDKILFGISAKAFGNDGLRRVDNNILRSDWQSGAVDNSVEGLTQAFCEHDEQCWANVNLNDAFNNWNISRTIDRNDVSKINSNNVFEVEEDTQALYVEYQWIGDIGGKFLRGSVGGRYFNTDVTSTGRLTEELSASVERDYSDFLPTLNLALSVTDSAVVRFSATKNVTRPNIGSLNIASTSVNVDQRSISSGNVDLKPYSATSLDLAFEWYFDEIGYASAAVFVKDIEDYITSASRKVVYSETGLPTSLLEGLSADTEFDVIAPINSQDSDIQGFELAFQRDLSFLPEPLNKLGVITNFTYADADLQYTNRDGSEVVEKPFPGLSEESMNFTLYYEAESWGGRISSAYRSEYISEVQVGNSDEDERGFHATNYVDFSAYYQLNEQIKFNLEVINLTDEREEQYSDSSDRLYNTTTSGTTYYVGVNYKF